MPGNLNDPPPWWPERVTENRLFPHTAGRYAEVLRTWVAATSVALERQAPLITLAFVGRARTVVVSLSFMFCVFFIKMATASGVKDHVI